jgi:hypothetical protein
MTCLKQLPKNGGTSAGCQPAIQQTASLRYVFPQGHFKADFGNRVKIVASAILADVEPWLPARRNTVGNKQTAVNS